MAVGLEIINANGSILLNENTLVLRFKRKFTRQNGWGNLGLFSDSEIVAMSCSNWSSGGPITFYVFEANPTIDNFGLQILNEKGDSVLSISESYAKIVGAEHYNYPRPRNEYPPVNIQHTRNFENYPQGNYAIIIPQILTFWTAGGPIGAHANIYREEFLTTSRGFRTRVRYTGQEQIALVPSVQYDVANMAKTVLIVDVSNL